MAVLGSGSRGNAAVVECGGTRLLVDAGLSAKQLVLRLRALGVDPASLDGILLSHEHGDHVGGLRVFLKNWRVPVFCTAMTGKVLKDGGIVGSWKHFEAGQAFAIGEASIRSFSIQHDAVDPVGFVIGGVNGRRVGVVTDVGHVTQNVTAALRGIDGLFIEANYDEGLLEADMKRPWSIKQRISSRHGHLSNRQCAELLCEIAHPGMKRVVAGHLSTDCNTPELVLGELRGRLESLGHSGVVVCCAGQDEPTDWLAL